MTDYDVVVCGAGVGGLASAHALGRLGLDVVVLDRLRAPSTVAKGELLQPEAVAVLDGWGLLPALHAGGTVSVDRLAIRDPAGRPLLGLDYRSLPGAYHEILCTGYPNVLRALSDGLPAVPAGRVTVRRGVLAEEALRDRGGRVTGVRVVEAGRRRDVRARLVVAADGLSSRLRRSAGLDARRADYDHRLAAFEIPTGAVEAEICAYRSDRGLRLVYPLPGGRCRLYVQVRPDEMRGLDERAWCDRLLAETPALAPLADGLRHGLRTRQVLAVHRLRAQMLSAPGIALVGEAAHAVHPMAAQGMNSSLTDAVELAAAVAGASPAATPDAVDRALRDYHHARRGHLDHVATVSHNAARMLTTTAGLARRVGRRMMRHTAANPRLLRLTVGNMSGVELRPLTAMDRLYQLGVVRGR
jgi:2-polyprenyl-6-methoxyphenol hydroxylase-like FAD-dependent oxidoreductase